MVVFRLIWCRFRLHFAIEDDNICEFAHTELFQRTLIFWDFMNDGVATLGAHNKHINSRANIGADLGYIILELTISLMSGDQKRDGFTRLVLRTLYHMRSNSNRLEVMP